MTEVVKAKVKVLIYELRLTLINYLPSAMRGLCKLTNYQRSFSRIKWDCSLSDGFSSSMNTISYIGQVSFSGTFSGIIPNGGFF